MAGEIEKPQSPNPQKPEGENHLPVFNPNRWLWDFKENPVTRTGRPSGPVRKRNTNQIMMWNLISSLLDFLFVGVMTFLVLWGIGRTFDTSVRALLMNLWKLSPGGTVFLFYSFLWLYHVATPALVQYTIGQWACQITRTPKEISFSWVLRSTFRLIILFMTGFIILPLFSWASGIDLEESLTGLKISSS